MISVFFSSRVLVCVQAHEITVNTHGLLVTLHALGNIDSKQKQHITLNWGVLSFMPLVQLQFASSLEQKFLSPFGLGVCEVGRWL